MKQITVSFKIFVKDDTDEEDAYEIVHVAISDMGRHAQVEDVELDNYDPSQVQA